MNTTIPATTQIFNMVYELEKVYWIALDTDFDNDISRIHSLTTIALKPGEVRKFFIGEPEQPGHRGILVGTRFGSLVVFERFKNGEGGIFCSNWPDTIPRSFRCLCKANSSLSAETMDMLLGDPRNPNDDNIGIIIERLFEADKVIHLAKFTDGGMMN